MKKFIIIESSIFLRKKRYELRKNSDFNKITECLAYSKAAATGLKCICSDTITDDV